MVPKLLSLLSGAAAFAPAARRWARSAPRALRGVARAAGDDGLSLRAERLKSLLLDEDFDGAAREGAAALEVLPDLADVARLRGRALLDPLLDRVIGGDAVDAKAFEPAYEAFRLAAVMNPGDSAEARDELARIKELCAQIDGDAVETTAEAVEDKALRFAVGARVACNTGRTADGWESGAVVKLYHRESDWPEGEVVPYQVRLDDGTLIYAPLDVDGCVRLRPSDGLDADVVVVGAGASGVGTAVALTRAFGLDPARVRLLERADAVGASFRAWPEEMRFISPSFTVHKSKCRDASPPRLMVGHPTHWLVYAQVVQPAGLDELVRPERRGPGHVAGLRPPRAASVGRAVRRLSRGAGR